MRSILLFLLGGVFLVQMSCTGEASTTEVPIDTDDKAEIIAPTTAQDTSKPYVFNPTDYTIKDGYIQLKWQDLSQVKFEDKYNESIEEYILFPVFSDTLKALSGKKIQIEGFVIPFEETGDESFVVLSAYPYLQCFFCGGAGPETVVDILPKEKLGRLKTDQRLTFKGKLRLNADDLDYLNYIMDDAELVK